MIIINLGETLKEERKKANLTQEELAEKLLISPKTISNWENQKTTPDIERLIILAKLFDLSLDKLLLEGSDVVKKLNKDVKKGRNVPKIIISTILITVFIFSTMLLIYEESTKKYRIDYEEHITNQIIPSVNTENSTK